MILVMMLVLGLDQWNIDASIQWDVGINEYHVRELDSAYELVSSSHTSSLLYVG